MPDRLMPCLTRSPSPAPSLVPARVVPPARALSRGPLASPQEVR